MKVDDVYKGFRVLSVSYLKDYASKTIYLRHEESGLEVFKLLNDDSENAFAFAFRTPTENSTGVAHAIEHSVLCGSSSYPLKDPFIRLENQSLSTYLNAYTCPDHTVYPSSSPVKADFYNIFSVYADAVFFPLLKEGAFLQECRHLELGEDGSPVMQGVVFNEMKGNYASFDDVAYDAINLPLLEGSEYAYDSGGDPLAIPGLSYEAFKDYHRRYYCTANCLCFLYGNIPLEEELDFLSGHIIEKIDCPGKRASYPVPDFSKPVRDNVQAFAPAAEGSEGSRRIVAMSWRTTDRIEDEKLNSFKMELSFLSELLWGDDSAPVSKRILASNVGKAIAPYTGFSASTRFPTLCFAMSGVEKGDEDKFRNLLLSALKDVAENGVAKEDFDRAAMSFDFSNREIKRPEGHPYSMVLMRRAVKSWIYGFEPGCALSCREDFEALKAGIAGDSGLISRLIRTYLLDNQRRCLVSVDPSADWEKERACKEKAVIEKEFSLLGKEGLLSKLKLMQDFQESDEDESCIPHLHLSDLPRNLDKIEMDRDEADGFPFFVSREHTNGICYFELAFPFDTLDVEDYPYLTTLASLVSQLGFKGKSWDQVMSMIGAVSGAFWAELKSFSCSSQGRKDMAGSPYLERDMFIFRFKCLDEKFQENLDLLSSYLEGMDFSDSKRIGDLLTANANDAKSSVLPEAHIYAMYRSARKLSPKLAIREILFGLTSVVFVSSLKDRNLAELSARLEAIFKKIVSGTAVIHVISESDRLPKLRESICSFVKRHGLKALAPAPRFGESRFKSLVKMTELDGKISREEKAAVDELLTIPGTVAFDASCCKSSPYGCKESMADLVFSHCLSMTDLWDKVRTKGGAYGVFFHPNPMNEVSYFLTYRDPRPFLSLSAIVDSLNDDEAGLFTDTELEKSITGCYATEIAPKSPSAKGGTGFFWLFNGGSNEDVERRVSQLLSLSKEDLKASCMRYRESFVRGASVAVLCPRTLLDAQTEESTGKIIDLPL
ncbi:MAG: insulinase family protein [Treponema sp.]|nr:insulinase family protein [Treponema sp.]